MWSSKDSFILNATSLTAQRYTCPTRPPSRPYKHHLYPVTQVSALITAIQARKQETDIRFIQYVVTPQKKILLAQAEGSDAFIPTHQSMAYMNLGQTNSSVLSAGFIFLSPEGKIMGISNESQDFPNQSLESILWVVAGLYVLNVPTEENLSIIPNTPNTMQFLLTTADRQIILEQLPYNTIRMLIAAHQDSKVIIRQEPQKILLTQHRTILFPINPYLEISLDKSEDNPYVRAFMEVH